MDKTLVNGLENKESTSKALVKLPRSCPFSSWVTTQYPHVHRNNSDKETLCGRCYFFVSSMTNVLL
jgi:hypothetical protein